MSPSAKVPSTALPLNLLQNTTYQLNAPTDGLYTFDTSTAWDYNKSDDQEPIITTLPQSYAAAIHRDGEAECLCTAWFKRKVLSTPGFPSPVAHPPKVVFEVREASGSGLGVFSTEDIKAGDLIVAERPLLVKMVQIPMRPRKGMSQEEVLRAGLASLENNMELLCSRMPPTRLAAYKALCNSHQTDGSGPLSGIWRTNGFELGVRDPTLANGREGMDAYSCVGAIGSRFNHSCSPNAIYHFNMPTFSMEFYAVRPIAKGEEISVAYCRTMDTAAERRSALKSYGFKCTCPACLNPEVSDKERTRVVTSLLPKTSQGVKHAEMVLAAFEAAGLQRQSRYIELLRRVAQINRKYGNKKRSDELDLLADKVDAALVGPPESIASEPPQAQSHPLFKSSEDTLEFIMEHGNPTQRADAIKVLLQGMDLDRINSMRDMGKDGEETTEHAFDINPAPVGL